MMQNFFLAEKTLLNHDIAIYFFLLGDHKNLSHCELEQLMEYGFLV
jgi:hypothetical protein